MPAPKQLTDHLHPADRRSIIAYFSGHPTVDRWEKIAHIIVGPAGFRVVDAVRAASAGKWPVIQSNGDFEIPDHLMLCRGLRKARELLQPRGSFFPTGGSPTAGGAPHAEVEAGLQPVAISG